MALILCIVSFKNYAQDINFKYIHKFSIKEGLSSYNIRKIVKDEYGYIWMATQDGLNRFDGRRFSIYNPDAPAQFKINASDIRDLIVDSSTHTLWVLTNIDGLYTINTTSGTVTSHFIIPYTQPDDWSQCFRKIGSILWIGCSQGLKLFDIKKNKWLDNPQIHINGQENSTPSEVGAILQDKKTNVWVFLNGYGIIIYDQTTLKTINSASIEKLFGTIGNEKIKFNSPVQNSDSTIVVGTSSGLKILSAISSGIADKTTSRLKVTSLLTAPVYSLSLSAIGDFYIGLDDKTIRLNSQLTQINIIKDKNGTSENTNWLGQAKIIFNDNDFIWIGSKEGLAYMPVESIASEIYSSSTLEFSNLSHIYDIEPVNSNEVLAGGKNGLYLINRKTKSCITVKSGIVINNLFLAYDKSILVAATTGIFIYKNNSLIPLSTLYPELNAYQNNVFIDNIIIGDSIMLIGTDDESGLLVWNFKKRSAFLITTTTPKISLGSNTVNDIFQTSDGSICILGDKIITLLDPTISTSKTIKLIDKNSNKELGPLFDIIETKDNYWVCAYGNGLVKLDKNWNVVKLYDEKKGLSNNGVYKVFDCGRNLLLITSNDGLSIFNYRLESINKIFEEKGLHANTFEEATGCFRNNEIYSGGPNGFCIINTVSLILKTNPPKLYINAVSFERALNERVDTFSNKLSRFHIPRNYTQATVYFSSINYSSPQRVIYKYKINEIQKDWINLDKQAFIDLIGIMPGTYHLQVQAFNEDGVPSEIRELTLIFLPKWYQTLWFKLLIVLAAMGAFYGLYRIRINQLRKEQQIKTRLASDLHDDLGSTMNSVKVYANLALMEKEQEKYLLKIKEGTQEAITGIKDMIWVLDDKKGTIEDLLARISLFASPLCEANNIQYKREMTDEARNHKLGQEERRNLHMMLKEAMNNAIKYAEAKHINIAISVKKGKPDISIRDDGRGFDTGKTTDGNGLKNMHRRVKEIKYHISIKSAPGEGTTINFQKI